MDYSTNSFIQKRRTQQSRVIFQLIGLVLKDYLKGVLTTFNQKESALHPGTTKVYMSVDPVIKFNNLCSIVIFFRIFKFEELARHKKNKLQR